MIESKLETWAVVEVMGHKKFAGFVTEQAIGPAAMIRVDVPSVEMDGKTLPSFSKLFGVASIYCISPCTEETARAFATQMRSRAFELYEAPRLEVTKPQNADLLACDECGELCEQLEFVDRRQLCPDCACEFGED